MIMPTPLESRYHRLEHDPMEPRRPPVNPTTNRITTDTVVA